MCSNCKALFKFSTVLEKFSKRMLKRNKGADILPNIAKSKKTKLVQKYIDVKYEYDLNLKKNMAAFQKGRLTLDGYLKNQRDAISKAFKDAYALGKEFGIGQDQLDDSERRFIVQQTTKEMQFMSNFANDLQNNSGVMDYTKRIEMYSGSLDSMFGFGRLVYLPEETSIIWTLGVTDKHCLDCLSFAAKNPYTKKTLPGFPKSGASRCFVGKGNMYPVLTQSGWISMNKIKIGDYVLSHKGKWKKVLDVIKTKCEDEYVYKITTKLINMHGDNHVYYMLNDHLSIVGNEWKRADMLKVGDKLLHIAHECEFCGKAINYGDKRAINFKYCSQTCSSRSSDHWAKGREKLGKGGSEALAKWKLNPENAKKCADVGRDALHKVHESRIGKTYEELYGKEKADILRWKCTKVCHAQMIEKIKRGFKPFKTYFMGMSSEERSEFSRKAQACINKEDFLKQLNTKVQELISSGKFKYSKPELKFINILNDMGINFQSQKFIEGRFFDFYLTDYDIYVEIDGDRIHANPKFTDFNNLQIFQIRQIKIDKIKNEIMQSLNKQFLRFWEDDVSNNISYVKDKISLVLKNHKNEFKGIAVPIISIEKVLKSSLVSSMVYSLTVEDHESYVTKGGLVAHNCLSNCLCSIQYINNNKQLGGEYDHFILDKKFANTGNRKIPSEYDYKYLMDRRDEYYYNRYMFQLTKEDKYKQGYNNSLAEFTDYKSKNNVYFPVYFNVQQSLVDLKEFTNNSKFAFISDYNTLKSGDFTSFFQGNRQIYGKVVEMLGTQARMKTLEGIEYLVDASSHVLFKEVI